jgi:hypothetical protein
VKIKRSMSVVANPVVEYAAGRVRLARHEETHRKTGGWYDEPIKWEGEWGFLIKRVTNSLEFRPGTAISKTEAAALIQDGWTLTVLKA